MKLLIANILVNLIDLVMTHISVNKLKIAIELNPLAPNLESMILLKIAFICIIIGLYINYSYNLRKWAKHISIMYLIMGCLVVIWNFGVLWRVYL